MKFQIYGKEFKSLIDRIGGIVPKKSLFAALENVKISASWNYVKFSATDTTDYASIKVYTSVFEEGTTYVSLADLKKISAIDDEIIITAENGKFDVRSAKKSYEILCNNDLDDIYPETPEVDDRNAIGEYDENEFFKRISLINCARLAEKSREMLNAFYLDLPNSKIVAIDGQRIGVAKLNESPFPNTRGIAVDGSLYSALKSLIGKSKNNNKIKIYASDKYTALHGDDYVLTIKNIEGTYFDYSKMVDENRACFDYMYRFDVKELSTISKEYSKIITSDNKAPMIFYHNNGILATSVQVNNYRTSDVLENIKPEFGMENEWYVGINPKYVVDACNAMSEDAEVRGHYGFRKPIMIMDETYEFLILPININDNDIKFAKKQTA